MDDPRQAELRAALACSRLEYLAEGRANVVYRVVEEVEANGLDEKGSQHLQDRLLRLRKDLTTTRPCLESHRDWLQSICPLFDRKWLVDQALVSIHETDVIARLNADLSAHDRLGTRPADRMGTRLAPDSYGLLVTNMMPQTAFQVHCLPTSRISISTEPSPSPLASTVIEFKPKWLVQSPNAPEDAIRCRHCALVAMKNAQRERESRDRASMFCPLDLISPWREDRQAVVEQILPPMLDGVDEYCRQRVTAWFVDGGEDFASDEHDGALHGDEDKCPPNRMLQHLANLQGTLDPHGPLKHAVDTTSSGADPTINSSDADAAALNTTTQNLLIAMTLRDCSIFLRVPAVEPGGSSERSGHPIEARIGDLDVKSRKKIPKWIEVETELLAGGWYTAEEAEAERQPVECWLARRSGSGRGGGGRGR